ncbi:mitochondrial 54S ribosomal protein L40 [Laspinema olomoucense]|uniref:mitochondrial 54S ribosomal protein L40 n=1 Tax=Laspinema olomoucense TaxID=3231600 RepID=UPI0021BB1D50|nr:mitochondrial 54S ribosomal protein L40 [Laspinema sp. D3d]MCT7975188.1 mitochondrial 54S ribosomal protein L40 [Laspinema sp. D3d]
MEFYQLCLDLNIKGLRLQSGDRVEILTGDYAGRTGRISIPRYWRGYDFLNYSVRLPGNKLVYCDRHELHKL